MAKRHTEKKPPSPKVARSGTPAKKASAGEWRRIFLETLASCGVIKLACYAAGITRKTAYLHRQKCVKFAEEWDEAIEDACDVLEGIGLDRAKAGSDGLLMFFLRANRPQTYRENHHVEHGGRIEHGIGIDVAAGSLIIRTLVQQFRGETSTPGQSPALNGAGDSAMGSPAGAADSGIQQPGG